MNRRTRVLSTAVLLSLTLPYLVGCAKLPDGKPIFTGRLPELPMPISENFPTPPAFTGQETIGRYNIAGVEMDHEALVRIALVPFDVVAVEKATASILGNADLSESPSQEYLAVDIDSDGNNDFGLKTRWSFNGELPAQVMSAFLVDSVSKDGDLEGTVVFNVDRNELKDSAVKQIILAHELVHAEQSSQFFKQWIAIGGQAENSKMAGMIVNSIWNATSFVQESGPKYAECALAYKNAMLLEDGTGCNAWNDLYGSGDDNIAENDVTKFDPSIYDYSKWQNVVATLYSGVIN